MNCHILIFAVGNLLVVQPRSVAAKHSSLWVTRDLREEILCEKKARDGSSNLPGAIVRI